MANEAHAIHQESVAAATLLANLKDVLEGDAALLETTLQGETNLLEVIAKGVERVQELKGKQEAIATLIGNLKVRSERFANQAERIRLSIFHAMEQAGLPKLELAIATLSTKATPAKANISAEADVPAKFWKPQPPKLDKEAVLEALQAGEKVPGASLTNAGRTLQIRDK